MSPLRKASVRGLVALVALAVSAIALFLALTAGGLTLTPDPGPLAYDRGQTVELPLRAGESATWGITLPLNESSELLIIDSVRPTKIEGVEVIGVLISDPEVDGGIGAIYGFPPAAASATAAEGGMVPVAEGSHGHRQLLVGVRLAAGASRGSIDGLTIRYHNSANEFQTGFDVSLEIVRPSS